MLRSLMSAVHLEKTLNKESLKSSTVKITNIEKLRYLLNHFQY
jgi:hypothetical protein